MDSRVCEQYDKVRLEVSIRLLDTESDEAEEKSP
jgi:hypothetical protein